MQASLIKFCGFLFDRKQGKLTLNDESFHLEHQQLQLLNLLIDNKESVVSREQIASEVWQGLIVEDNTISKAITRLRKILNDSAKSSQIIKTIPKKGYQFIAHIDDVIEQAPQSSAISITPIIFKQKRGLFTLGTVLTVLLIGLLWLVNSSNNNEQRAVSSAVSLPSPITYREGIETNAHLHSDLNHLLFIGDFNDGYAIFTKEITGGQASVITEINSRYVYPKWLNVQKNTFVYSDLDSNNQCQIFKVTTTQPTIKEIMATCLKASPVEVFVDEKSAVITWSDDAGSWQHDLVTGNRKSLPFVGVGVRHQMPSPNGLLWATLTPVEQGALISIYDRASKKLVLEKQLPYSITHFKWSKNSDSLYHLGEHPANQLFRLSLDGEQTLLASTSQGTMTRISDVQSPHSIEFVISTIDLDIHQLRNGIESKLINSPFPDYNPALSQPNKYLAYASKRTGSAQIWVKGDNGKLKQVTNFERATYIYDIAWSPNENKLLVKRNDSIHIIDIATNQETILPIDARQKIAWQWLSNHQITYVDKGSQSLFSFDIRTLNAQLIRTDVKFARYANQQWFISDSTGDSIVKFNADFSNPSLITERLANRHWIVDNEQVYLVDANHDGPATLVELNEDGTEQVVLSGGFNPASV
ncbi:MAG: hypothetical protein BM565_12365, partial [Gammaproteobacteria bacterium MedPE]